VLLTNDIRRLQTRARKIAENLYENFYSPAQLHLMVWFRHHKTNGAELTNGDLLQL